MRITLQHVFSSTTHPIAQKSALATVTLRTRRSSGRTLLNQDFKSGTETRLGSAVEAVDIVVAVAAAETCRSTVRLAGVPKHRSHISSVCGIDIESYSITPRHFAFLMALLASEFFLPLFFFVGVLLPGVLDVAQVSVELLLGFSEPPPILLLPLLLPESLQLLVLLLMRLHSPPPPIALPISSIGPRTLTASNWTTYVTIRFDCIQRPVMSITKKDV
jgi:hypothetical protein